MKFYGREDEVKRIGGFFDIVKRKGSRILVVTGRRRIGKTRLVLESVKNLNSLYFFTKKKRIDEIISEWSEEIRKKLGNVFYGKFENLEDFLTFLFEFSKDNPMVFIFDEIQNFLFSAPSGFGTFQKMYDLYREKSNALLVFLGSSFTLMNKIFKDSKEPLFGRASDIMTLSYLPLKHQREIMEDHGFCSGKNMLHLFSIFDGIPKYIEELVDVEKNDFKESLKTLIIHREFLWDEGENLLKEEFGKEYTSYYSVLSAISKGRRRLNEIEQFCGIKDASPYLKKLEELYKIIERKLPVTSKSKKERNGRYYIKDNFLDFWFRFIESKRNLKEINQADIAFEEIWSELPRFEGRKLEDMVIRCTIEENPLDIKFYRAGRYWDRKGEVDIDAAFVDDKGKKAYVLEVKINREKITKKQLEAIKNMASSIPALKGYEIIVGAAYINESGLKMEIHD